jgi:all-trans-retinol dehydrogenase (NAD+)
VRELAGRRVLVTGAARGIGRALAERFAAEGAEVVITDLDGATAEETAAAIRAGGATASAYPLDVTDRDAVAALREQVARDHGPIDVLVNNAGTVFAGPFLDVPLERHELTYRVNTLGVVTVTHVFLPDLIERPDAHVVIISSASGLLGVPFGTTYASSKWAALGFGESLRLELAELGHRHVHVTTVCPSLVSSGLFDGSRVPRLSRWLTPEGLADTVVRAVARDRPLVLTPLLVKLTPVLRGVLPLRAFDSISAILGANRSLSAWTGHVADARARVVYTRQASGGQPADSADAASG